MAAAVKFQDFVEQVLKGKHDFDAHAFHVYLSNAAPSVSADAVKADLAEISAGNGYSADGIDVQNTIAETGGTATITGTMCVFTASGGSIGPFQYVVLMNFTQTSPLKPLVVYWDYGTAISLNDGETLSVKFNNSATTGTIATLA